MKRLTESLAAKIAAIILSFIMLAVAFLSAAAAVYMIDNGFYTKSRKELIEGAAAGYICYDYLADIFNFYERKQDIDAYAEQNHIYYAVSDENGEVVKTNYSGETYLLKYFEGRTMVGSAIDESSGELYREPYTNEYITVTVYIPEETVMNDDYALIVKFTDFLYSHCCSYRTAMGSHNRIKSPGINI